MDARMKVPPPSLVFHEIGSAWLILSTKLLRFKRTMILRAPTISGYYKMLCLNRSFIKYFFNNLIRSQMMIKRDVAEGLLTSEETIKEVVELT